MKTLTALCLLAASGAVLAQTPAKDEKVRATAEASARTREAEEAKTRKQLEEARERLDKAAREVAELSGKLGAQVRNEIRIIDNGEPRRAVLGVQIDDDPSKQGARVISVSPGGPAAEAGLRDRDIIIAVDGEALSGSGADRALVERMRKVKPDQKVKVRVLRDGKKHDYVVVARPMGTVDRVFAFAGPEAGTFGVASGMGPGARPLVHQFRGFWPGEFAGLELASITPKLGAYFGVDNGVLVVSAPKDGAFKLEDGDVLQAIDGRKPDDGPHALRILRSYRAGEKLNLSVLRQRKPVTLAVTMPERPEAGEMMWDSAMPMIAPLPPVPAAPGSRVAPPEVRTFPDGAGSTD